MSSSINIAVLPGDGIGIEVMEPCLAILKAVTAKLGTISLQFDTYQAGAIHYREHGVALPASALAAARKADAILLGAMGWPDVRYPDGTEIAPQIDLRMELDLYAGVRPVRTLPNVPGVLADPRARHLDFVIIRESTEGLFASRRIEQTNTNDEARDTLVITRKVSEKLFDFSFALARQRKKATGRGTVTCVDKANVFSSFAFFRKIFDERAAHNADVKADHAYVDAMSLFMVRRPWELDVLVTENMFGDILSDLGAGLLGGLGFAPSADIGDHHAVFQPCHGTAPDIAGQGRANPVAMILSAAMMLEWLGEKHDRSDLGIGGRLIRSAVDDAFRKGLRPLEIGGPDGTRATANAVLEALKHVRDPLTA